MPVKFYPKPGHILICDFQTGFVPPEIVKERPVVVISTWSRRYSRLCTVVPLSQTAPRRIHDYHVKLNSDPFNLGRPQWAKCDLIQTVSLDRLDRPRVKQGGRWRHGNVRLPAEELSRIYKGVLAAINLGKFAGEIP